jgi:beta-phosphoglucomutase-like phosphatase (HAD superfamily)
MPKAAIFDIDGTLVDSVDLHAIAWQEALVKFGHDATFEQARSQIGKGGDQLIPVFLRVGARIDRRLCFPSRFGCQRIRAAVIDATSTSI